METATITQVKNGLSAYIDKVKAGESILLTDRGVPVAVLEPVSEQIDWDKRMARLERAGLVSRGRDAQRRPVRAEPKPLEEATAWLESYRTALEANFQRLDALLDEMKRAERIARTSRRITRRRSNQ